MSLPDPLDELARLEGVPSALAAARDAVDVRRRRAGLRGLAPDRLAAARRLGADASAGLTDDPDRWRPGSRAVALELDGLSRLVTVSPLQAIARTHVLVVAGQLPESASGRVRRDPAVADRMQGLARLLTRPTTAPALVLAAVAHAEIATVSPFDEGNGLVARAVERMVLMATGVDPQGAEPVEVGHLALVEDYRRALAGYGTMGVVGVRDWLVHCATALQIATTH